MTHWPSTGLGKKFSHGARRVAEFAFDRQAVQTSVLQKLEEIEVPVSGSNEASHQVPRPVGLKSFTEATTRLLGIPGSIATGSSSLRLM
jgi:hypothetical protein